MSIKIFEQLSPQDGIQMTSHLPMSIRYLRARLQVLKRPTVWGSILVLSLPLIFLMDYWSHPEKFANFDRPVRDSLTDADTATAPAISDPSTILDTLLVPATPDQASPPLPLSLQPNLLKALTDASASDSNSTSETSSVSPFRLKSDVTQPSQSDGLSAMKTDSVFSITPSSIGSSSTEAAPVNPLQSALDRHHSVNSTGQASQNKLSDAYPSTYSTSDSSNPELRSTTQTSLSSAVGNAQPNSTYPNSAYPTGAPRFSGYGPQTSPYPGTTGYTVPPSIRTGSSYATPNYSPSTGSPTAPAVNLPLSGNGYGGPGYRNPGYGSPSYGNLGSNPSYSNLGNSTPSYPAPSFTSPQLQQPAPFSVPRTPPGRYIGGGEINTFSNP